MAGSSILFFDGFTFPDILEVLVQFSSHRENCNMLNNQYLRKHTMKNYLLFELFYIIRAISLLSYYFIVFFSFHLLFFIVY